MTDRCAGDCARKLDFPIAMAFQPVVDLAAGRIYAFEALVRGPDGQGAGWVLDQVNDDNRYAFDQACRVKALAEAARLGMTQRLNINFLPNAVYSAEACLALTLKAAAEHGFPLNMITFEFTENEEIHDRAHLTSIIETYSRFGFKTALDDFGAGYAGLSLLAEFQPQVLKFDRLLVEGVDASPRKQAILAGLAETCRRLNMSMVAEGVETYEEARCLLNLGITRMQGYYFGRPLLGELTKDAAVPFGDLVR